MLITFILGFVGFHGNSQLVYQKPMTQTERVIKHLKEYGSITPLEAIKEYGITRLGARIWDLRDLGYDIETQTETSKNRFGDKTSYAKYVLKGGAKNESVSRH